MDKNETYRRKLIYRQNCVAFSQHHGIKPIKKKNLRRCNCTRIGEEGTTIALTGKIKKVTPVLNYDFSYQQTADKIGTFTIICNDNIPMAVLFVYCTGETFITYDMTILFFLKNAGYRDTYAIAI